MTCVRNYCPWVPNASDANHYKCLNCGRERYIGRVDPPWVLLIAFAVFVTLLINSASDKPAGVEIPKQSPSQQRRY